MVLRCTDSFGLGEGIEDGEREISVMGFDRLIQPVGHCALPRRRAESFAPVCRIVGSPLFFNVLRGVGTGLRQENAVFGSSVYSQPTRRNRQNKPAHTSRIVPITLK